LGSRGSNGGMWDGAPDQYFLRMAEYKLEKTNSIVVSIEANNFYIKDDVYFFTKKSGQNEINIYAIGTHVERADAVKQPK
jgi:hypothetical protein